MPGGVGAVKAHPSRRVGFQSHPITTSNFGLIPPAPVGHNTALARAAGLPRKAPS